MLKFCMAFPILEIDPAYFPLLQEIPQPPQKLTYRGNLPPSTLKLLAVVGSRKYSTYGKQVVEHLIGGLRGYPVGIVSGLALGIDSLAHASALDHELYTLAVPGSGISNASIYPASHRPLAQKILEHGGGLLSEFDPAFTATKWSFAQRNRIMAGITHATLIIEAGERSGTLITARMAVDYNRELLVVPGSIFSHNSAGGHQFLKLGATPITHATDILEVLGIAHEAKNSLSVELVAALSPDEQKILSLLTLPLEINSLIRKSGFETNRTNVLLMEMEFKGLIAQDGGIYRTVI